MKIGIMTFWWSADNYGQQMQAWALQQYLKGLGHEPFLIRYISVQDYRSEGKKGRFRRALNPKRIVARLIQEAKNRKNDAINKKHPRAFEQFREAHFAQSERIYHSLDELRAEPPEAEMYICGSDQIWNYPDDFDSCKKVMRAFFLDFGKNDVRRIAYAASFGRDEIPSAQCEFIKPLLAKFERVSVREPSGIQICANAGYNEAVSVVDPTLLLPAGAYRQIMAKPEQRPKYCYLYIVGNKCDVPVKAIKTYCQGKELRLEYTASQSHFDRTATAFPTVPEWLSLIAEAECVITNSYHGMIFSILFNRPFAVLPLNGGMFGKMNNRIRSLLSALGCSDKIFEHDIGEILESDYPWEAINRRAAAMSDTFLKSLA
jgi:hypothetical protein